MKGKDTLIPELTRVASSMMQGALSQIARRCGDPACACFRDPARRHGPHLYWNFRHQGRLVSVYVPAAQTAAVRQAHAAWLRFLELGTQISARNREPFLKQLQREKKKKKKKKRRRKLPRPGPGGGKAMIEACRLQSRFADGLIREEVQDLWEPWMRQADAILQDEALLQLVYEALGQRAPKSKTRGRRGTPAEQVLRLLVLKHARDWSFEVVVREVRANLVYREFTRVGGDKVPDDKTLGRVARQLGPTVIEQMHQRLVAIAQKQKVVSGRKLRLDTTVIETPIHYPTDSSLMKDGVRVLTRVMKKATEVTGEVKTQVRDRTRSVKKSVIEIDRAARNKTEKGQQKLKEGYKKLLETTRRVVGQAKQVVQEIAQGVQPTAEKMAGVLQNAQHELETMIPRVQQVIRQTRQRLFEGNTRAEEKIVSVFEPETEIIRKGKASKPTEFGKLVKIQEAENQIITHYEVFDQRPSDSHLLVPSIEQHQQQLGCTPKVVAADPGFFSVQNETAAAALGVPQVSVPQVGTKNRQRRQRQKKRWFKKAQKWRAGGEGRISVLKRRHGLNRCLYKGPAGMKRWVGLGVIADTLINIGVHLAARGG